MYLLKLAMRPWHLAPFSQLFSALAVGVLLLSVGFVYWMERGLGPVIHRLQSEQVVTAYLNPQVEKKDESRLLDTIRTSLGAHAETAEVRLVTATEFAAEIKSNSPELANELDDLGAERDSVIPRYISISGLLAADAVDHVKSVTGIESAESSKDRYHHIVGAFTAIKKVSRFLIGGLILALITGLIHLSRMNSHLHKDALLLLRFWGASDWMLRVPGILSGLWVGLAGGAFAAMVFAFGGAWLGNHVRTLSPMLRDMRLPGIELCTTLLICGAILGIMAGAFGGLPSAATLEERA